LSSFGIFFGDGAGMYSPAFGIVWTSCGIAPCGIAPWGIPSPPKEPEEPHVSHALQLSQLLQEACLLLNQPRIR